MSSLDSHNPATLEKASKGKGISLLFPAGSLSVGRNDVVARCGLQSIHVCLAGAAENARITGPLIGAVLPTLVVMIIIVIINASVWFKPIITLWKAGI